MNRFALFAILFAGCATETPSEFTVDSDEMARKERIACGGFAGFACPDGMTCVDDPSDSCDPATGGADCIGYCKNDTGGNGGNGGRCKDTDTLSYVGCGSECDVIRFSCSEGYEYFSDSKGCGCQLVLTCGDSTCGSGEFCCNESCGICAPEGGFCTQQFCDTTGTLQ